MKFTVQGHRITRRPIVNRRNIDTSVLLYHYITKGLFTAIPFTRLRVSTIQQKFTRHTKCKKHFKKTEQSLELQSGMAGMFQLVDKEFLNTMINILRTLMEKIDNMQEHMANISREMEILRKNE